MFVTCNIVVANFDTHVCATAEVKPMEGVAPETIEKIAAPWPFENE